MTVRFIISTLRLFISIGNTMVSRGIWDKYLE